MTQKTFLVEIGTEELPPKLLRNLAESFATRVTIELNKAELSHGEVHWYATPRRLALKILNVSTMQRDREVKKRGPEIVAAFDARGIPTKAAKLWAHSCGITIDQSERLQTNKGKWLIYRSYIPGKSAQALLPAIIARALSKLPVQKLMRWGNSNVQFVRPVHTVTLLFGNEVIPSIILGIKSGRILCGHRFMGNLKIPINDADQYPQILETHGKVIADYNVRKDKIKAGIKIAELQVGGNADLDDNLLEEVTSLVEWPVVLIASFEKKFLALPPEALVFIMKGNQKYFPVYDKEDKLLPYFIFVINIESSKPQQIIAGNEKVIRPRLADAKFFFDADRKKCLEDNLQRLKSVLFHQRLGTLYEKTNRIQILSSWIAREIGVDTHLVSRAGLLSKCDLVSNMVFEFTDTQGVMGMYYAYNDGEAEEIAIALNEQYKPRFSGDKLPSSLIGCALAISDKIDTLAGIFGINQHPKGDKDPFALRRAALGILRIIVEKYLPLDLQTLTEKAVLLYGSKLTNKKAVDEVIDFMLGRFRTWYHEKGYGTGTIQAVLARRPTCPADFAARIEAVSYFCTLDESIALITANKRVSNILKKTTDPLTEHIDASLLKENEEIKLASLVIALEKKLQPCLIEGRYQDILIELAKLREVVDNFFDKVLVNTEEKVVRINRLSLLAKLRKLFLQVADISSL